MKAQNNHKYDDREPKERIPKPKDFTPQERFPEDHRWAGARRCTAWNPNAGRQCRKLAKKGLTKCRTHGGASLRGMASPSLTHGKTSRYLLPKGLQRAFDESLEDPDLLDLTSEIALVDVQIFEYLTRLDIAAYGPERQQVLEALESLEVAQRENKGINEAINNLSTLLKSGSRDDAAWRKIVRLIDKRRKLVLSEVKREVTMRELVHVKEVRDLFKALTDSVRRHVKDRETLAKIQQDFITLTQTDVVDWPQD